LHPFRHSIAAEHSLILPTAMPSTKPWKGASARWFTPRTLTPNFMPPVALGSNASARGPTPGTPPGLIVREANQRNSGKKSAA
jgi:hypothetical protein